MFVGVGASRVRDMFEQAKKNAPCIIFIDEIDAVGRHRGAGLGGGNDEREQTLNQLLVEMDGFEANEGIILIAATNRPDVLDPALLRPGRFDRQIVVPNPDVIGREKILKVHARKVPLVARRRSQGGRARHAGLFRRGSDESGQRSRVARGAARQARRHQGRIRGRQGQDHDGRGAPHHGHDRAGKECSPPITRAATRSSRSTSAATDPVHKATIIPRGRALGMVMQLPERDKLSMSYEQMTSRLAVLMGGRVSEEVIFGKDKVTSGAQSDIEQATKLARAMVTRWGFSDELGTVMYGENQEEVFLGYSMGRQQNISEGHFAEDRQRGSPPRGGRPG